MKLQRRHLQLAVAFVIVALAFSFIGYAATPTTTITINGGQYPGAPSYTIYKIGSTYYAKDQNGYEEFSGTNASSVIQNAINAASEGSTILLAGQIALTTGITVNKALTLKGENWGAIDAPNIVFSGSDVCITISAVQTLSKKVTLSQLEIDMNDCGTSAINITGVATIILDRVEVWNSGGKGLECRVGGTYIKGTIFIASHCAEEGWYQINSYQQLAMEQIYTAGNGEGSGSNIYLRGVGGWIGQVTAAGAGALYGGDSQYGLFLYDDIWDLSIGQLNIEDTTSHGLILGSTSSNNDSVLNLNIGLIRLHNTAKTGGADHSPLIVNSGSNIHFGSLKVDDTISPPYTYGLQVFNVTSFTISSLSTPQAIFRYTFANDNKFRILMGYADEYP